MFWRPDPGVPPEVVNALITMVMRMDAKLDQILFILGEDNGEEEREP